MSDALVQPIMGVWVCLLWGRRSKGRVRQAAALSFFSFSHVLGVLSSSFSRPWLFSSCPYSIVSMDYGTVLTASSFVRALYWLPSMHTCIWM
jgi:hypothetical protein